MYNLLEFNEIDSTQLYARTIVDKVNSHILITAKIQTNGIGQRGNKWMNLPGNFCGSFIFKNVGLNLDHPGHIAIVIAASIGEFFIRYQFENFSFKWPNDIYDKNCLKKLGGILCEIYGDHLIIGIGINFDSVRTEKNIASLTDLGADHLLKKWNNLAFFKHIHQALKTYNRKGFSSFHHYWENRCGHMNRFIQTSCKKEGIFIGLQTTGFPQFQ